VIHNEDDDIMTAETATRVEIAAHGSNAFSLKPKELKGESLFKHMVQHRLNDSRSKIHTPIVYLGIEHSEAQVKELGPDAKDLRKCSIMCYAYGDGATMKLATQKFDNPGYVKFYGGMQNDSERPVA
jgi:uncharacterized radical SAM superfamily Fe-S cluster-containing enzyme